MRVALERHVLRHANRPVLAHAPEIVPPEIDEHHVLGPFLLVALQLLRQPQIFAVASRPCPGNRMGFHAPPFHANEHLRRRPTIESPPHADEIHTVTG